MSADGERIYVVPGRVELVGKHVDYAGGRSLTCAVDRAITATVRELAEPLIRVRDEGKRGFVEAPLSANLERGHGSKRRGTYVVAVARRFARDFPHARTGIDVTLRSTLPPSAGLSSSSALVVAIASALVAANPRDDDDAWSVIFSNPLARAEYFGAMETGAPYGPFAGDDGVGARGTRSRADIEDGHHLRTPGRVRGAVLLHRRGQLAPVDDAHPVDLGERMLRGNLLDSARTERREWQLRRHRRVEQLRPDEHECDQCRGDSEYERREPDAPPAPSGVIDEYWLVAIRHWWARGVT